MKIEEIKARKKWFDYLSYGNSTSVNLERVKSVSLITGNEVLEYVLKTLEIFDLELEESYKSNEATSYSLEKLSPKELKIIKSVLEWSEVSKCGSLIDRESWKKMGYDLEIHNLASAEIYKNDISPYEDSNICQCTYKLIASHGLIGQAIRGEVACDAKLNKELYGLVDTFGKERFKAMLLLLNKCIIAAVSNDIWCRVKADVEKIIDGIINKKIEPFTSNERLRRLCPKMLDAADPEKSKENVTFFENNIFNRHIDLWYFESSLGCFAPKNILKILELVFDKAGNDFEQLKFKPVQGVLYYDYYGIKSINVYKKRIIEHYLETGDSTHVGLVVERVDNLTGDCPVVCRESKAVVAGNTVIVSFKFSAAAEKLCDFCVEAERSGILSYEKSIIMIFDMFHFRRDGFDRLNNEDSYLSAMNDADESTKESIVDFAVGDEIVDVGSGGGVLLDLLENKYPDKKILGTDISENVIETLTNKKQRENHNWSVMRHNFVEGPLFFGSVEEEKRKATSIIFSSILHEVYSYTDTKDGKFNIDSVKKALSNAYESLKKGGRIIIRDGIKTDSKEKLKVTFKTKEGMDFFKNYVNDFKGLKEIKREFEIEGDSVCGDINFMREFLYTYTWGIQSYAHEVQEQFGYMTMREYKEFFDELGANVIEAKQFFEEGYREHLSPLVELDKEFPDSNCIIVVEKRLT